MTNREFFSAIAANETIDTELRDFATAAIGKLDAKNASAKGRVTKADREVEARRDLIKATLTQELETRDQLAAATGLTVGQVSAAMRALIADGIAVKETMKVEKASKVGYRLA